MTDHLIPLVDLKAQYAAIRADVVTAVEERELFRLIAIVLDCPLPPDVVL